MSKIAALRTPDAAFAGLPDWPYDAQGVTLKNGLRMAYVDEGPRDAPVFLCLHGQPTWSYLYRKMIPVFVASGARVVAPDLLGFGRSDKPVDDDVYTFAFHRDALLGFVDRMDLQRITLVVQDWGGLLGLTLPMDRADRFERLLVMNTVLGLGGGSSDGFDAWRQMHRDTPNYDIAALMQSYVPGLGDAEAAAYAAPFPDNRYRAGARRFPLLVMTEPDMPGVDISRRAAQWWKTQWQGDSFMAIGMQDRLIPPRLMVRMHDILGGRRAPLELPDTGHFVQENGAVVARAALEAWGGV